MHTMSVPIVGDMGEMYKATDCGALACILGKLGVEKSYGSRLDDTRQVCIIRVVKFCRVPILSYSSYSIPLTPCLPCRPYKLRPSIFSRNFVQFMQVIFGQQIS